MKALIVGADRVEPIKRALRDDPRLAGLRETEHWSGRKVGDERRRIPGDTALVVVVCDRISHPLLRHVRDEARRLGLPMLYARHSLVEIREKLADLALAPA
ncbi:MAG: hypothetical protein REI09_11680 [Candidatus Dactylopiibacterium sp.]|nr:hypothetical protein [Candidatus Dactylopiibacterium sp.]